ncbi:hypothetical protein [Bacillus sp. OAE603]|uniref:hypothetical protein n=1 Tax=Gottfriedia sp. OAE603 TaxID=2663872 RepID=UPI00178A2EBF
MNRILLTLTTLMLTLLLSINAFAASDSTNLDQSYEKNNKRINRDFDHDFYDPNHVMDDKDNILNNTKNEFNDMKNDVNRNVNELNNGTMNNNGTSDTNRYYERTVTPKPVGNTLNPADDDVHMNYGWLGFLALAALLGLIAYFMFRRKERVD